MSKQFEKYQKKPVVIEAYQTSEEIDIQTLDGVMHADIGDWIIKGIKGELYPCKPDIFNMTYMKVDSKRTDERFYYDLGVVWDTQKPKSEKGIAINDQDKGLMFVDWLNDLNNEIRYLRDMILLGYKDHKKIFKGYVNNVKKLENENKQLKQENKVLKDALRFSNYE